MESVFSGRNRAGATDRTLTGKGYEWRARHFLQQAGLEWVASNVR